MAQGRPLSRHGRYDAFVRQTTVEEEGNKRRNSLSKPHDSYPTQVSHSGCQNYTSLNSPDEVVFAHCMSGQDKDRTHNMPISQPRPPSSSGRPVTSNRPPSSSIRPSSAKRQHSRQDMTHIPSEDLPDRPPVRPPSSFSKYQPLPAIGAPISSEKLDASSNNHHHDATKTSMLSQLSADHNMRHFETNSNKEPNNKFNETSRISFGTDKSALSDNSALSRRIVTHINKLAEVNVGVESIERLDLTQLDKPDGEWKRKHPHTNSTSSKSKGNLHQNITTDTRDLYDGDDDDSDDDCSNSTKSPVSKHGSNVTFYSPAKTTVKKPVVIPSPDNPPPKEVLLAVKLPTDGTRHQKYFTSNETLQSIVEFAEEMAGRSFTGYILVVASPPNSVFVDLEDTIENAGLEDKTVFHLEEYDWTD